MTCRQAAFKRILDIMLSGLMIVFLSPLLAVIAALVRLDSPGPILFTNRRLGEGGKPFTLYKFRTMYAGAPVMRAADGSAVVCQGDPRITRVGRYLREFSLDELPQLVNVLHGEMALVGPRPDQQDQLQYYSPAERRKLKAKPGLTGLASIKGRDTLTWAERTHWENYYIDNYSLMLDLEILLKTVPVLLFRRGVYTVATVEEGERDQQAGPAP